MYTVFSSWRVIARVCIFRVKRTVLVGWLWQGPCFSDPFLVALRVRSTSVCLSRTWTKISIVSASVYLRARACSPQTSNMMWQDIFLFFFYFRPLINEQVRQIGDKQKDIKWNQKLRNRTLKEQKCKHMHLKIMLLLSAFMKSVVQMRKKISRT